MTTPLALLTLLVVRVLEEFIIEGSPAAKSHAGAAGSASTIT